MVATLDDSDLHHTTTSEMIRLPVDNLSDQTLNWAVAKVLGFEDIYIFSTGAIQVRPGSNFGPANDHSQAGRLIAEHGINVEVTVRDTHKNPVSWRAAVALKDDRLLACTGATYQEAAMRALVTWHVGINIEVPSVLHYLTDEEKLGKRMKP